MPGIINTEAGYFSLFASISDTNVMLKADKNTAMYLLPVESITNLNTIQPMPPFIAETKRVFMGAENTMANPTVDIIAAINCNKYDI